MAATDTTKILTLDIDYHEALKGIADYTEQLDKLKQKEKELKEAYEKEGANQEKIGKQLAANKIYQKECAEAVRVLTKEVRNKLKVEQEEEGSLKSLRAQLSNLTKEYDELSRTERESARGQELKEKIEGITKEIKGAEYATLRFYRNVGNYPKEIVSTIAQTTLATGSLKQGFIAGGQAAVSMGKQLLKLMTNPFVLGFAAVVGIVAGFVKAMGNSEERTNRLKVAFAAFEPIINAIKNAFGFLADVVTTCIEAFSNSLVVIEKWIGINENANNSVEKSIQLEKDRQEQIKRTREFMVEEAQLQGDVDKLRNDVAQKDKFTLKERLAMLDTAIRIEEGIAAKRLEIAKENLRILEEEAKKTENDAEMNQKLAEAKRAVIEAENESYSTTRRLQQQRASLIEEDKKEQEEKAKAARDAAKQRAAEAKRRRDEEEKNRQEAQKAELKALQDAEDAMLALVQDGFTKQYEQKRIQGEREIEALRKRLETEKNLTETAREAINQTILAKEKKLGEDLNQLQRDQEAQLAEAAEEKRREQVAQMQQDLNDELEAYKRYVMEQEALAEEEKRIQQEKVDAIGGAIGGLANLLGQFGEQNKAMAKLSKILALAEIAINTGKAVAAGIAQAQSVPFPANIGAIMTTITSIMAGMASAVSSVKSAKFSRGGVAEQTFSNGGKVVGAGTGTSDSIPARLSNGESVLTELTTRMFSPILSSFNQMGGGVPIQSADSSSQIQGEMMLARSYARALQAMPNPVVSVVDINQGQRRVEVLENIGTF